LPSLNSVTLHYIKVIYSGLSTRLLNHYYTRCTELETETVRKEMIRKSYPFLKIAFFAAYTLCHAVTLKYDPPTLKVYSTLCVICSNVERNQTIPG